MRKKTKLEITYLILFIPVCLLAFAFTTLLINGLLLHFYGETLTQMTFGELIIKSALGRINAAKVTGWLLMGVVQGYWGGMFFGYFVLRIMEKTKKEYLRRYKS